MAKGFEGLRDVRAQQQAGRGGGGKLVLPKQNDEATVRFADEGKEIAWCWGHEYQDERGWRQFTPCLDADDKGAACPMCEHMDRETGAFKRKVRMYVNLIWRNRPKREKRGDTWVDTGEKADAVVRWEQGINTYEKLDELDSTWRGLMSRDFKVRRKATTGFDQYSIVPADPDGGPQPLSDGDRALIAEKPDLEAEFCAPLSYEEATKLIGAPGPAESGGGVSSPTHTNMFARANANRT